LNGAGCDAVRMSRRVPRPLQRQEPNCPECGLAVGTHGAATAEPSLPATMDEGTSGVEEQPAAARAAGESGVRGWLNRRKAEHDERRLEDDRYRAALAKVRGGDDSAETLAELRGLADPRHRSDAHAALLAFSDGLLADDLLSSTEEERWQEVGDALGVTQADLNRPEFKGLLVHLTIARINDGRLPEVPAGQARLMAKRGEIVHLETGAALMKEVIDREFRGGSRGVSVPIAKGVRFRTGSFRGKSVVVGSHMEAADTGIISVSSKRIVFMGTRKTIETPTPSSQAWTPTPTASASTRPTGKERRSSRSRSADKSSPQPSKPPPNAKPDRPARHSFSFRTSYRRRRQYDDARRYRTSAASESPALPPVMRVRQARRCGRVLVGFRGRLWDYPLLS
jgi:hypothetical protein